MQLSLEQMGALKKNYTNGNPLNVFTNIKENEGNVKVEDDGKALLEIASNPDRTSKIILQDGSLVVEKYAYLKGDKLAIVENTKEGLEINDKVRIPEAISNFAEFIGLTQLKSAHIEITLSKDELLVFLALVDIYREKALLINLGKGEELSANFAEIRAHLEKPLNLSLVTVFNKNYNITLPKPEATKPILDSLTDKKIVAFDKKFTLVGEYAIMAVNFLVPNIILNAEVLQNNGTNNPIGSSALVLNAGIKDNLLFMFGNGEAEVMTVSSSYVLNIIDGYLRCPKLD